MEKETKCKINFTDKEIEYIKNIQFEINQKQKELQNYVRELQHNYKLDNRKLCILSYKKAVEIDKYKREYLGPRHYKLKEFTRLAYISWVPYRLLDGFQIHFNTVSSNDTVGNEISLYELEDISYEILDNCTIEEARKILKNIKNTK